jgi:DNA (cytosine-5)-methyltransferase 1
VGDGRVAVDASEWPVRRRYQSLSAFLKHPPRPLSFKATRGFLERTGRSGLIFPTGFLSALRAHETRMAKSMKAVKSVKSPSVAATF